MSSASNSKVTETPKPAEQPQQEAQPHVGVLEEDDEFEEFPVAGGLSAALPISSH